MADDIAPELLEKVQSEYRRLRENDSRLARIREKTAAGFADGKDLDAYAAREGELLAEALRNNISGDDLPNGKMYFNIANRVLPPVLEEDYSHVADIAEQIQQNMNQKAGIRIRAQRPDLDEDRVNGLVNLAATAEQYEDRRKELEGDVVNFSQSVVTDSVRKNADFQYKAGLSPKIVRTEATGCCKWCSDLAGTYDYASVKATGNAVWQRHRGCGCIVEYDPGNGSRQNAHTKQYVQSDNTKAERIRNDQSERMQIFDENARKAERIQLAEREEQEERNRRIHYGERQDFYTDRGTIRARAVDSMGYNKIYVDEKIGISPRELREIDRSVSKAKEIHGIAYECDASVLITDAGDTLAAYNPRTNMIVVNRLMGDPNAVLERQIGFAAENDLNSTMVHELFHWKDAEEYKRTVGEIKDVNGVYTPHIRLLCEERLIEEGIDLSDDSAIMKISRYAYEKLVKDNDTEEVYTEYRTLKLLGYL